jgi:hypothetical protein
LFRIETPDRDRSPDDASERSCDWFCFECGHENEHPAI